MNLYCTSHTFLIKLIEGNYVRYEDENDPFCEISISASDGSTSFTFDGFGLYRSHLETIISEINNTLAGKHNKDYHLKFPDPKVVGGDCYSPISFLIHSEKTHEEDYWEFIYETNGGWHNSGKNRYSFCFCTDDLKKLKAELEIQINNFNWPDNGKIDYYELALPDQKYNTAYSAAVLREELSGIIGRRPLKKLLVDLHGYIDSNRYSANEISFSCVGGPALLLFDDIIIDLSIHGEGMIRYRVYENINAESIVKKRGYAPRESYNTTDYYYDLSTVLSLPFEDETINKVEIQPTDTWAFSQSWFDEEKAASSNDLPNLIKFKMSNNVCICFVGDCIEYYHLYLEQC